MAKVMPRHETVSCERVNEFTVSEINTILSIMERYCIPLNDIRRDMYEDMIETLESERFILERKLSNITATLSRLTGL